jgi:hypothetical protein
VLYFCKNIHLTAGSLKRSFSWRNSWINLDSLILSHLICWNTFFVNTLSFLPRGMRHKQRTWKQAPSLFTLIWNVHLLAAYLWCELYSSYHNYILRLTRSWMNSKLGGIFYDWHSNHKSITKKARQSHKPDQCNYLIVYNLYTIVITSN